MKKQKKHAQKTDACLICGEALEYWADKTETMVCSLCGNSYESTGMCRNGHYVCDNCHTKQCIEDVKDFCLKTTSKNPIEIMQSIADLPSVHMHGPEHHIIVGCSLLAAYHNSGGHIDLPTLLSLMIERGKQVPGGVCGFWGSCGAGISTGIFVSLITGATPYSRQEWGLSNLMTSKSLLAVSNLGGPRCCKRNSYTCLIEAVDFIKGQFSISMELPEEVLCHHFMKNAECLERSCPFYPHKKDS